MKRPQINILGTRGIPASHGGFETFVAKFAPYLIEKGWNVVVYCQADEASTGKTKWVDQWEGVTRVHFSPRTKGALATIEFDLRCVLDVLGRPGVDLVLGYNTAILIVLQRLFGRRVVINMDGIEWKRQKWSRIAKAWLWLNEWLGANLSNHAIADHPEIKAELSTRGLRRSVVIPYGADRVDEADDEILAAYALQPQRYFISIARIEPENSILEIVKAFSRRQRDTKLIVLGKLDPKNNKYHAEVLANANGQVVFPGGIYDQKRVQALRFHCLAYMHGHQVGGTNPSLVEALGAGSPVIAHDNRFNRWVAGPAQRYFASIEDCIAHLDHAETANDFRTVASERAHLRHSEEFTLDKIHGSYFSLLSAAKEQKA